MLKNLTLSRLLGFVAIVLLLAINVVTLGGESATATGTVTSYSQTAVITPPPATSFTGTAGGDGWGISFTSTNIYNVFHHMPYLRVMCHVQTTAATCPGFPVTVTDSNGYNYATSSSPQMWIDQTTQHMYVYATALGHAATVGNVTGTAGVVCVDLTNTASPNCGFTPLANTGESQLNAWNGWAVFSPPMFVGSKWYAFNYVATSASTGTQNTLMCFDTATLAACPSQPYSFDIGTTNIYPEYPPNGSIALGTKILLQTNDSLTTGFLSCFDTVTAAECAGNYPMAETYNFVVNTITINWNSAPFPTLSSSGAITGYCLSLATLNCYDMQANAASTPAGFAAAMPRANSNWNGNGYVILGTRLYVPDTTVWASPTVDCYDYASQTGCTNFPFAMSNQQGTYSVNFDPFYPTCLWVNSDYGSSQIKSFDAYTTGSCGSSGTIVPLSTFINTDPTCMPATYTSLTVTSPAPSAYSGGTVQFLDASGNPIVGIATQNIDANGFVDLSSLGLESQLALPQAKIALPGAPAGNITLSMAWTANYDTACTVNGQVAVIPTTTTTAAPTTTTTAAPTTTTTAAPTTTTTAAPTTTTTAAPTTTTTAAPTTTTTASPTVTTTTQPLAFTGSNSSKDGLLALDLFGGGVVAMLFVRKRRTTH